MTQQVQLNPKALDNKRLQIDNKNQTQSQQMSGASVQSSIVNTINTIIGAGMLVLPYAFRTDGIFIGSFILIFAALTSGFGMYLQGVSSKFLPESTASFFTVCMITYPHLSVLFDLSIALQCFGVGISYVVLTGDLMPLVFPFGDDWSDASVRNFYILTSCFLTVPLCYLRRLDSLKYTSVLCLIAIAYLVLLVYWFFFVGLATDFTNIPVEKHGDVSIWKPESVKSIFKTLGIIVLAYTCPNQFSIVGELERPTLGRIYKIVFISMSITTLLFWTVALFGYLTFGNYISGNILLVFDDSLGVRLGRGLLVLMVLLSYPLMFHPARISFNNIYHWFQISYFSQNGGNGYNKLNGQESQPLIGTNGSATHLEPEQANVTVIPDSSAQVVEEETVPLPQTRFIILSTIMLISSYLIAYYLKSFEFILSIVGATGGVMISFVLPGCYGFKLIATQDESMQAELIKHSPQEANNFIFRNKTVKFASLFLAIWGIFTMIVCLWSTISE
ncbi:unnamed protein product [Ambrosiozyma monospora]|uniref:Unnamed protein product n=1 Tax=Ambrosiozyma monospora TaxID=43982 RepID=A0A9W6YRP1_AMBMO|nr:unnamed protein product [Ambrosiozyma monospora]